MSFYRGRRLRRSPALRTLVRETALHRENLIMPYFVVDTPDPAFRKPIAAMPGQSQLSLQELEKQISRAVEHGLHGCLLFGIPAQKDEMGSEGYAEHGIIQRACRMIKENWPDLLVITDVCLCEYTSHGHCGVIENNDVANDPTLELLSRMALSHVRAGADIVAPSDMMDGRVGAIREALDAHGFTQTPILSYSIKYASSFYGPFREAAESAPKFGDRKTYQMDPPNWREAIREADADVAEGADMLMVKPAGPYLDVLLRIRETFALPLCAYQVSGEYSMLMAAIENGWLNKDAAILESLLGIRRAGADFILSYFTEYLLENKLVR